MAISVATICGTICVQPKLGELLRSQIIDALAGETENVEVNFKGVEILTSSFLNVAVGSLYGNLNETIVDAVEWSGLDESDQSLLKIVIKNAKRFYALTDDQKSDIVDNSDDLIRE